MVDNIVTSKITGQKIKVNRIYKNFITGYLVGFIPSESFHLRFYNGFCILSFKNMQEEMKQLELF